MDSVRLGTEVAGYRLDAVVGRGGMGVVYRATHLRLNKTVALKVLSPEFAQDAAFRRRFEREWQLAASLDHPHIIDVYDAGGADGVFYLAMRLIEGMSLATLLDEEAPLDLDRTLTLMAQVASALDAAHDKGLAHRDVKPANILIASSRGNASGEHVYLVDFGISRRVESTTFTENPVAGTWAYMAPEQFRREPQPASDRYALACVLYQCLSGSPPFVGASPAQVMHAHLNDAPPSLARRVPGLSSKVDQVLAKALAKSPNERYPSCAAFVEALRSAASPPPPPAPAVPAAQPERSGPRKIPWLPLAVVLGLVIAGLAAAFALRSATDSPGDRPPVEPASPALSESETVSAGGALSAVRVALDNPQSLGFDQAGNLYVSDFDNHRVHRIDRSQTITTVAGNGMAGSAGDGGFATEARLEGPTGVAVDGGGNVYIADTVNHRVRKVDPSGIITTVAGTGAPGFSGDGGSGIQAQLNVPQGLAVDQEGNLYIADNLNSRVRKVDAAGVVTTVAGVGLGPGFSGDGGPATEAQLQEPTDLTIGGDGSLYIADSGNARVRRVDPAGIITTVAGNGVRGFTGDGGPATQAQLNFPADVAVDDDGSIYIADASDQRVRQVGPDGTIATVAGTGSEGFLGDNGDATRAFLNGPAGITLDVNGSFYIADSGNHRIRRVDPSGTIVTIAGNGEGGPGFSGDEGPAVEAQLNTPTGITVDESGNLYVADYYNQRVRKIDPDGVITTFAGTGRLGFSGDGGPATQAQLDPLSVAADGQGNLYIADASNHRIRKVDPTGVITTVAGTGGRGFTGDGGPATQARLTNPSSAAVDAEGNLYIVDAGNHRVRKVDSAGIITTIVGDGTAGFSGDGGPATQARLNNPVEVAIGPDGSVYIADGENYRVRVVDPNGVITTVAGNGVPGFSGEGGPATRAQLGYPVGLAIVDGTLYIGDLGNSSVRRVSPDGIITTLAGNGRNGFSGDGGPATQAQFDGLERIAIDGDGNLYIADTENDRIRKVDADGIVTTVAGGG